MNNCFTLLSLFSGAGGLDLGFAQAGAPSLESENSNGKWPSEEHFKVLWANDVYEPSCRTYSENFGTSIYQDPGEAYDGGRRIFAGDVSKVGFYKAVGKERVDVISGGFPCQDFSIVRGGKREGVKVKRGKLYCHFVRALVEKEPAIFVSENVKGLLSANKGKAYEQILDDFRNLNVRWEEIEFEETEQTSYSRPSTEGYRVLFSGIINFANLGVPQARERLVTIGLRKDLASSLGEELCRNLEIRLNKMLSGEEYIFLSAPLTPLEVFNGKTLDSLDEKYVSVMKPYGDSIHRVDSDRKKEYVQKIWPKYSFNIWKDYMWLNRKNNNHSSLDFWLNQEEVVESHKKVLKELGYLDNPLEGKEFEDGSNELLTEIDSIKERMKHIPPGENHEFVKGTEHKVTGLMSNIYKRTHPIKPSPTVIARGGGGTWGYHYMKSRQRLTNRERGRLQTFPDRFLFKGKYGEVRRQLGEAVPPLAGKRIAEGILPILEALDSSGLVSK